MRVVFTLWSVKGRGRDRERGVRAEREQLGSRQDTAAGEEERRGRSALRARLWAEPGARVSLSHSSEGVYLLSKEKSRPLEGMLCFLLGTGTVG